jgi:hypothetical protein
MLHPREKSWIEYVSAPSQGWLRSCQRRFEWTQVMWPCGHQRIDHKTFALLMKASSNHRFARARKKKVCPLAHLTHECSPIPNPTIIPLRVKSKIVHEDRLLLRFDYRVTIIHTETALRDLQRFRPLPFYRCLHSDGLFKSECLHILLPAMNESTTIPTHERSNQVPVWIDLDRCVECATDSRIRISRERCNSGNSSDSSYSANKYTLDI